MGKYTITLDSGTTNTRAVLWDQNRQAVAIATSQTGVRNTAIDGNNKKLQEAVRLCICKVLKKSRLEISDVDRIIASGMITSDIGLEEVPHVSAPADAEKLAGQMKDVLIKEVCSLPISFIPGIKNCENLITIDNYATMDIMRGEEVESIAIMEHFPKGSPYLLVLPGSHMKFVAINDKGEISGCLTTISGELLSAVTHNTVIADAVGHGFLEDGAYDQKMVLEGYRAAAKSGIGHACFLARILNRFVESDHQKIAGFVLGAVLQSDLMAVRQGLPGVECDTPVIICGKYPFGKALMDLMQEEGYFRNILEFHPEPMAPLAALGAFIVADARKK